MAYSEIFFLSPDLKEIYLKGREIWAFAWPSRWTSYFKPPLPKDLQEESRLHTEAPALREEIVLRQVTYHILLCLIYYFLPAASFTSIHLLGTPFPTR